MKELKDLSYNQLVEYSKVIMKEMRSRAYAKGYEQGVFDGRLAELERKHLGDVDKKTGIYAETPQQKRDRIVEQAKRDVEELINEKPIIDVPYLSNPTKSARIVNYTVEFFINKKNRAITALIRGLMTRKVRAKGIAKCAPNDCFNVHIGKAIALRRALGLDVPDEYLNAPQPSELREGDIVEYCKDRVKIRVCTKEGRRGLVDKEYKNELVERGIVKILDDSSEGVDDSREEVSE